MKCSIYRQIPKTHERKSCSGKKVEKKRKKILSGRSLEFCIILFIIIIIIIITTLIIIIIIFSLLNKTAETC